jgi:hypothetical protein
VANPNPGCLPGAVLIKADQPENAQKWTMAHEFGHALDIPCKPANWAELVAQTDRNRFLEEIRAEYRPLMETHEFLPFNYNVRPDECWAYAVTQYLAKDAPWLMESIRVTNPMWRS